MGSAVFANLLTAQTDPALMDPALIRARCEVVHQIQDQSILYGVVVDGTSSMPLPGSHVHLTWVAQAGTPDSTLNQTAIESEDGAYIFCDVPQNTRVVAWANALGMTSRRIEFFFEGGESAREDLSVELRQFTGAISGRIIDNTTEAAIRGATVRIIGADASALTDSNGRFRILRVPIGPQEAMINHIAYGEPRFFVTVSSTSSTHLVVRLDPQVIALEPISVEVTARRQWLERNGFYDRVDSHLGQFVTPREIDLQPFRSVAEVLRTVPAVNLRQVCKPHCSVLIEMAGNTMPGCIPTFYLDGRRVSQLADPDGTVDLDMLAYGGNIAAVEVYRGISETPPEFFGRCGSIVIWTRRGGG